MIFVRVYGYVQKVFNNFSQIAYVTKVIKRLGFWWVGVGACTPKMTTTAIF